MTRPRPYLVRHGETDWNAEGRLDVVTDRPLNDRGKRQAAALAADLAGVRWDRGVLVAARARPADGGDRPRRAGRGAAAAVDERLIERGFGPYEGWSEAELAADPVASAMRRDGAQLPGIEPEEEVDERVRRSSPRSATGAGPRSWSATGGRCGSWWRRPSACRRPSRGRSACATAARRSSSPGRGRCSWRSTRATRRSRRDSSLIGEAWRRRPGSPGGQPAGDPMPALRCTSSGGHRYRRRALVLHDQPLVVERIGLTLNGTWPRHSAGST